MRKNPTKTFCGGLIIGLLAGALIGGFTVACIGGAAFVNFELAKHSVIMPTTIR